MDGRVCRVSEIVVTSLDVVQNVAGVLERANDFSRLERGNAGRHAPLYDDRHALGDGAPEPGSSLAGNRLSALS